MIDGFLFLLVGTVDVVLHQIIPRHLYILRFHPVCHTIIGIGAADNSHQLLFIGVERTGISRLPYAKH